MKVQQSLEHIELAHFSGSVVGEIHLRSIGESSISHKDNAFLLSVKDGFVRECSTSGGEDGQGLSVYFHKGQYNAPFLKMERQEIKNNVSKFKIGVAIYKINMHDLQMVQSIALTTNTNGH